MGKIVSETGSIRWKGDVFNLFQFPSIFSTISPQQVHSVHLHSGNWGTVGSTIIWSYNIDGVSSVVKERIEAVDEEKKTIMAKVIEGDVMQAYKEFKISVSVNAIDGEESLVTWTFDYEKRHDAVPDPTSLMDACLAMTKRIENRPVLIPN